MLNIPYLGPIWAQKRALATIPSRGAYWYERHFTTKHAVADAASVSMGIRQHLHLRLLPNTIVAFMWIAASREVRHEKKTVQDASHVFFSESRDLTQW